MDGQKLKQEQLSTTKEKSTTTDAIFQKKINMTETYDNDISTKLSSKKERYEKSKRKTYKVFSVMITTTTYTKTFQKSKA